MRRLMLGLAAALLPPLAGATAPPSATAATQADLDQLAARLGYRFAILDNKPADCPTAAACFISEIAITTPDRLPSDLARRGLEIRYGFTSRVLRADSDRFDSRLINGDLNALILRPGASLEPGRTYRVRIYGEGHFFSRRHAMPNAHLLVAGLQPRVIAATRARRDPETGLELLPFVAPMTDEARLATASPEDRTRWLTAPRAFALYASRGAPAVPDIAIVPKPAHASRPAGAALDLARGVDVKLVGVGRQKVAAALAALGVGAGPVPLTIAVTPSGFASSEAYRLTVSGSGVRIEAGGAAGASYALRSLAQQVFAEGRRLRPLMVDDAPRFGFRGLHIDLARNFHSKAEILKLVEQMATYKLNKLHLHLGDDEGWRLQIASLPELTEIGAYRCPGPGEAHCLEPQLGGDPDPRAPTNGFFSRQDYLDILAAAKARQIEVIPSFDMPGHSRAAIRSMEVRYDRLMTAGRPVEAARFRLVEPADRTRYRSIQNYDDNTLNVCLDSTYRFLETVLADVAALHREAGTPLKIYHIGGDETAGAWTQSPACAALMKREGLRPDQLGPYFIERVSALLAGKGVKVAGWSDGLGHADPAKMPKAVQTDIWGGLHTGGVAEAHDQMNRGWDAVISMPDVGYFDMPYAPDPDENGYDWASRGVSTFQVFGFMPQNLPANGALIPDIFARPTAIDDKVAKASGRDVMGLQAQLWSETVRTDAMVDYMLFPRLFALAERAWTREDWAPPYVAGAAYRLGDNRVNQAALLAAWRDFAGRVGIRMRAMDRAGVGYRLAPPGARIRGGLLEANTGFPGPHILYRERGGAWRPYTAPVRVNGAVELRSRAPDGRRVSRIVTVDATSD